MTGAAPCQEMLDPHFEIAEKLAVTLRFLDTGGFQIHNQLDC
jgi:hypothetical protein